MDLGDAYYDTMTDNMLANLKKTLQKYSEEIDNFSMLNSSTHKPISISSKSSSQSKKTKSVAINNLSFEGLDAFKISNLSIDKNGLKLNLNFLYKKLKLFGSFMLSLNDKKIESVKSKKGNDEEKPLVDISYWNTTWSSSLLSMIGRQTLDMRKVRIKHSQRKIVFNIKHVPSEYQADTKKALLERIEQIIDSRIAETLSNVMIKSDLSSEFEHLSEDFDESINSDSILHRVAKSIGSTQRVPKGRLEISGKKIGNRQYVKKQKKSTKKNNPRVKRDIPTCDPGEELDDYIDSLFNFSKRLIKAMDPITAPNITIELPDYNLKIFLYDGKVMKAFRFRRAKQAWAFCNNSTISLGITVMVEEARMSYKYRVITGHRLLFDGDLQAKFSPRAQLQFSQKKIDEDSEEPVQQRVDRFRLYRLGKIVVVIRGLGNLTQSLSLIINQYLNDNQERMQTTFRMLEPDGVKFANKFLKNVTVPILSIV